MKLIRRDGCPWLLSGRIASPPPLVKAVFLPCVDPFAGAARVGEDGLELRWGGMPLFLGVERGTRPGSLGTMGLLRLKGLTQDSCCVSDNLNFTHAFKQAKVRKCNGEYRAGDDRQGSHGPSCTQHLASHTCLEPLSGAEWDGFNGTRGERRRRTTREREQRLER